jgi:hypothetical protein
MYDQAHSLCLPARAHLVKLVRPCVHGALVGNLFVPQIKQRIFGRHFVAFEAKNR